MIQSADRQLRLLSVCRVSSREQSEGYSLDSQAQANQEWADRKGHIVVETVQYVETASKRKERRRFQDIVGRVRRTASLEGIVFHKVDRASRNLADLAMLERLEMEEGKHVFFSSQEFPQNAAGRLGVGVMGVAARWYTDNLKEEINKGFRGKVEAGEYPHRPPYGYCMGSNSEGRKLPVPDPERAGAVRRVFELMATGEYTLDTLRDELVRRGIHFRSSRPGWARSHLARLLHHPFYVGKIPWRGQVYQGKHEPLVDPSVWQRVQEVLGGRSRGRHRHRQEFTYGSGLIRCGECGHRITGELHKRRYRYYRCAQVQYREHQVPPAWVPEQAIESQLLVRLNKLVLPEEIYQWAMAYLKGVDVKSAASQEKELRGLRQQASRTQSALDALLLKAAEADNALTDSFMRVARLKQEELGLLRQRIREVEGGKTADGRIATEILELAQHLPERFVALPGPRKRQITDSVFLNLRLDGTTLDADYRLPFAILAENGNRPINSGREDLNLRLLGPKPSALPS